MKAKLAEFAKLTVLEVSNISPNTLYLKTSPLGTRPSQWIQVTYANNCTHISVHETEKFEKTEVKRDLVQ